MQLFLSGSNTATSHKHSFASYLNTDCVHKSWQAKLLSMYPCKKKGNK